MAQRRMIDKKISISEQVSKLSANGQLFFTWCIPHADDLGLLPFSPGTLKALIIPRIAIEPEEFAEILSQLVKLTLFEVIQLGELKYYRVVNFSKLQTLKKDRKPVTIAENINSWDDWNDVYSNWNPKDSNRFPKIREDKRREPPLSPPKFSPDDGLEIWNRLVSWNNNKTPLARLKNKGSIEHIGLLKRCNGVTEQIRFEWNKKKIKEEDWRMAINKYIVELINRTPTSDYCNHRFSMLEFVKQANGYIKFLNR